MDPSASESSGTRSLRRSTRHSAGKPMNYQATPRGPLKRTRRSGPKPAPVQVQPPRDLENGVPDDDDSPTKRRRVEADRVLAGGDHHHEPGPQEPEPMDTNRDLQTDAGADPPRRPAMPEPQNDGKFSPIAVIPKRCPPPSHNDVRENLLIGGPGAPTKPPAQLKAPQTRPDVRVQTTTMQDYKRKMEAKAMSADAPTVIRHVPSVYPPSVKPTVTRQRINNIPSHIEHVQHHKTETKKAPVIKKRSGKSCMGWCPWPLIFIVLLICVTVFLATKYLPVAPSPAEGGGEPSRNVKLEAFTDQVTLLQARFPSQRPEVWKRSKIHLGKHLTSSQPTEPVSLIFTAAAGAEGTLRCLARGLAASFSSALNASVLHIDGAGAAGRDSDQVKLDIDTQLQAAFEGDKPAAVIHRLEELPPGSTLIFYRYCDHENAAYKRAFLLFTVLLPQGELGPERSLKEVEESVQDYLRQRLVDSNDQVGFDKMDGDKYGGLWSRISHLILPVVSEEEVEQNGC